MKDVFSPGDYDRVRFGCPMRRGDVYVPKETPRGPVAAREAWADALGGLMVVEAVRGTQAALNCPTWGETHTAEISVWLGSLEPIDCTDLPTHAAVIERAATAAAYAAGNFAGDIDSGPYWEAVARAVMRTMNEIETEEMKTDG